MRFSLFIQDSPEAGAAIASALGFMLAALDGGDEIRQVFLHGEAVRAARAGAESDHDLRALVALARQHQIPLLACSTWLERLGVAALGAVQAGSLGQWCDALDEVDRVVSFRA
jgi:sulfur relay (sulfurtransferase) complex TusBCD TusD component (DsrE family)